MLPRNADALVCRENSVSTAAIRFHGITPPNSAKTMLSSAAPSRITALAASARSRIGESPEIIAQLARELVAEGGRWRWLMPFELVEYAQVLGEEALEEQRGDPDRKPTDIFRPRLNADDSTDGGRAISARHERQQNERAVPPDDAFDQHRRSRQARNRAAYPVRCQPSHHTIPQPPSG